MNPLDELKKTWMGSENTLSSVQPYDQTSLERIFKSRVKRNINASMQYFWASFTLQILVYALFSHVIVKYWSDTVAIWFSLSGMLLFLPFTIMLMRKFKSMAKTRLMDHTEDSLQQYVQRQHTLLLSFYRFKKRYEYVLIPLSSAIGIILFFKLYVPGGVFAHPYGAGITFIITIVSCVMAIRSENKKSFDQPLRHLQELLQEFEGRP